MSDIGPAQPPICIGGQTQGSSIPAFTEAGNRDRGNKRPTTHPLSNNHVEKRTVSVLGKETVLSLGRVHPLHQRLKASIAAHFNKMWVPPDPDHVAHVHLLGLFQPVQRIFFIPQA